MKSAVLDNGERGCCLCLKKLDFPKYGGMMPPIIGDMFVCWGCFDDEATKRQDTCQHVVTSDPLVGSDICVRCCKAFP